MRKKLENKKGFTLAELLVVVAIIAILIAIVIPVYSASEEKAREAVDLSAIRNTYAEAKIYRLENGISTTSDKVYSITLVQRENGWKTTGVTETLNKLFDSGSEVGNDTSKPTARSTATVTIKKDTGNIILTIS